MKDKDSSKPERVDALDWMNNKIGKEKMSKKVDISKLSKASLFNNKIIKTEKGR